MKKKFLISTIIPIYNSDEYLDETIKSILNQSLGFKKNIQLILINDGSTDNSEKICLKYKEKYPDNIIYKYQKNAGVSAARNKGKKLATAPYINFLDSDDKWERGVFKDSIQILEKYPEIPFVSYRIKFFDRVNEYHPLDFKYNENKIVNIKHDPEFIQLSSSSLIFRAHIIKDYKYDEKLKISEDFKLITQILLKNNKYFVSNKHKYLYRKRSDKSSTIDTSVGRKTWYNETITDVYLFLIKESLKEYNIVIPYIQEALFYDLKWRVFLEIPDILSKIEKQEYIKNINKILSVLDKEKLMSKTNYTDAEKINLFKYLLPKTVKIINENNNVLIEDYVLSNYKPRLHIDSTIINKDHLELHGKFDNLRELYNSVFYKDNLEKKIEVDYYELDNKNKIREFFDPNFKFERKGFKMLIDLKNKNLENFYFENEKGQKFEIVFSYNAYFSNDFKSNFMYSNSKILKSNFDSDFKVYKNCFKNRVLTKAKLNINLLRFNSKHFLFRFFVNCLAFFHRKEIWLISDRAERAGDNGEAFFRYLQDKKLSKKTKIYFVINSQSKDVQMMKDVGKVLYMDSFYYKAMYIISDFVISSHANDSVINPVFDSKHFYSDFTPPKFVFLQHGVTKDDLSPWLNVNNKTIDLFVTSGKKERNSLLEYNYNYKKEVPILTGLPRFDKLKNLSKTFIKPTQKTILIIPTWRASLALQKNELSGERIYNPNFKNSNFFKFYNSLLNDKKLLKTLQEKDYKIRFVLHPEAQIQINDFEFNDMIQVVNNPIYAEEFVLNDLLITDFSSVLFDFAYLKKPVIHTQFDADEFYKQQIYDAGYFEYKRDGFGPVVSNFNDSVKTIIKYIENDCKLEDKYLKRINDFFYKFDNKNCERVYKEILKLQNKK